MKALKAYLKMSTGNAKASSYTRSVLITKDQERFLKQHGVNLSRFVRDSLDDLIESVERSAERSKVKR